MDKQKVCKVCGVEKSLDCYYKSQRGLTCIDCFLNKNKERKNILRKNVEFRKFESEKQKERRFRLWQNTLVHDSKRKGVEHTITVSDINQIFEQQNGRCYWFNVPLIPSKNKKNPQQPSIDRLDRNKGYIKENIVLCSYSANIGRNENTVEDWEKFIEVVKLSIGK